jgi:hypothetical protein
MKKLSSLGTVVFAALVAGLAVLGFSVPAQAYPDAQIDLTVNRDTVYSGQKFEAKASSDTTCDWRLEWNGTVRTGQSSAHHDFKATFTAPHVRRETKIPLDGTCRYSAQNARGTATWHRSVTITVLPPRSEVSPPKSGAGAGPKAAVAGPKSAVGGSDLPGTGGPNALFLVGGLVLLLSGATAVTVARRRAEEAEIRSSRA